MILVCYDIRDDRRRYLVDRLLIGFGVRVQKSVFECHLTPGERVELERGLLERMDPEEDNIRIYTLCDKDLDHVLVDGCGEVTQDWDYLLL